MSELNQQDEKLVGVEVSTSAFKAVCVDKNGNLLHSHKTLLNRETEVSSQLINFINEIKTEFGNFSKIGVALPGLLSRLTKKVAVSTHIPQQIGVNFADDIRSKTGLEAFLENDANAAAYGEFMLGAGRGSRDLFYVTLGTGVGGALIFDGKIWRGVSGFAGEFGYIAIDEDGRKLEDVASKRNIVRRITTRFHQDTTSSLVDIDEDAIKVSDVVREAQDGDDFARLMLERTGNYVGAALAGVINLLNIERIVIGGEVMEAENLVLDAITQKAKEFSFAPSFATVQILKGQLGENATAIGVAILSAEA
jgi:glucokinase